MSAIRDLILGLGFGGAAAAVLLILMLVALLSQPGTEAAAERVCAEIQGAHCP